MSAGDINATDRAALFVVGDLQPAMFAERQIELADLIGLGQVRIVILLAIPFGEVRDVTVQRQGRSQRQVEGIAIHDRQSARQSQTDRAGLSIGVVRVEFVCAAAEEFGLRFQLGVNFQPDNDSVRR